MKRVSRGLFFVVVAAVIAGCSGYNKLIKSGDSDLIYNKGVEYYKGRKYQKALQLFEQVAPYYAHTSREDSLTFYTGAAYFKSGDFETSGMILDDFRRRWGRSPFAEEAEYMYAKGFYYMSPAPERDQKKTQLGIIAINEYLSRYPSSIKKEELEDNIRELTQKLHDKAFLNARTYYTIGRYKAATVALKNALDKYPDSNHREELLYLTAKSSYLLAKNSIESMQRDRYLDMMDDYYNYIAEFPSSRNRREVDKMQEEAKAYLAQFSDEENSAAETTEEKKE